MAITQYASPEYRYSDYDTEIMEDYDNRIGTYNKALTEFQALAEPYQGLVDTYNTQIGTYNTDLGAYKADADAYNAAIAEYNAGPRTEEYAGVASPGQFTGVVPIFEGGAAPVAPEDPGFSGEDVDAFMKTANERAQQSGAANATALAVMNDPTQTYRTAAGDVNLAGMSGFGSTAMGFAYGGPVTPAPIDPMTLGPMGQMMGNPEIVLMPEEPTQVLPQSPVPTMQMLAPPIPQADSYNPVMDQGVGGQFQRLQQKFQDGGIVSLRPPVRGPDPQGMAKGGVPSPETFNPELTETNFEYTERPSYPEVRQMYVNILESLSDEEIQSEYGVSKKDLGETLAMLDVQYTYGSTDGPEGQGERFTQTPVSAPPVLESERPQMRPGSEVVSTTTGMMGMGPDGTLIEYGTEPLLNAEDLARLQ